MGKKLVNTRLALISGNAFFHSAQSFIESTNGLAPDRATEFAISNIGKMIASATNLSLAIEIYLKGILAEESVVFNDTHDLSKLYKNLPESIRQEVEVEYESRNAIQIGKVGCFHFYSGRANIADKKFDIKSVLKRTRNTFVVWRYLYESEEGKPKGEAIYEFYKLSTIGEILENILKSKLNKNA